MKTCVSLRCPFVPFCKEYNFLVDRGEHCPTQAEILERAKRYLNNKKKKGANENG